MKKNNSVGISVFSYQNKEKYSIYVLKKCCEETHFCHYCLQAFRIADVLKCHIKDCFTINGKQKIKMPKKVNILDSKVMKKILSHHL